MKRFSPEPISMREIRIFPERIGPDEPLVPELRGRRDAPTP
ncbi:hypothetical protein [Streptosporangium pseudovulgare]|nr:hypothetical protein [Streptosporangium pseudovulgare]